jgi:hypothetical protein
LTRYRRKLVESQVAERNRLLKLLESANIKLASVAADVFGLSGQLMLRALIEGKASPQEMAELAKGRMRAKIPELEPALEGKLEEHHRFLLRLQLQRLEAAEKDLAVLEQRIQEKLKPYAAQLTLLDEIPGVDWTTAAAIIYVVTGLCRPSSNRLPTMLVAQTDPPCSRLPAEPYFHALWCAKRRMTSSMQSRRCPRKLPSGTKHGTLDKRLIFPS